MTEHSCVVFFKHIIPVSHCNIFSKKKKTTQNKTPKQKYPQTQKTTVYENLRHNNNEKNGIEYTW